MGIPSIGPGELILILIIALVVLGPGKLPAPIAQKMNEDVNTVLAMPDVQERLDTYGAEDGGGSAEKFSQFIRSEQLKLARVVNEAGVKGESSAMARSSASAARRAQSGTLATAP